MKLRSSNFANGSSMAEFTSLTHSLVDLPRWGLATADDHSDIFLLHCARSCDIFSWMYSQPVSSIHCLLGLPWCRSPSMIPSRTVSTNCPALPRVMWPKYCSFSFATLPINSLSRLNSVNYGRPLSVSGCPCYILPMFLFIYFLWPPYSPALVNRSSRKFYTWWTLSVIREVTTWIFSWSSLNYSVGHKVTKFGLFSDPPANFLLSRPNAAEYCNSEKKLVKHRWLLCTQCHVSLTLAYQPLRSTRHFIILKK